MRAMRHILAILIFLATLTTIASCGPAGNGEPLPTLTLCELDKLMCDRPDAKINCQLIYPCDGRVVCYRCNERNICYECGHALQGPSGGYPSPAPSAPAATPPL